MKRAFTLIEMMIVVAILAILMTVTFRLTKAGGEETKRTTTIVRMQKIENCLSGYYAAFGSYPPVKLHGSRDIYMALEGGDQNGERNEGALSNSRVAEQVQVACRAQPFGCEYPPSEAERAAIEKWGKGMSERVSDGYIHFQSSEYQYTYAFDGDLTAPNPRSGFSDALADANTGSIKGKVWDWSQVRLFKFGVMSFLLPRYLFMMRGDEDWFGGMGAACLQWSQNNDMPSNPLTGYKFGQSSGTAGAVVKRDWEVLRSYAGGTKETAGKSTTQARLDRIAVENIPSQAVCARWMPNFAGICQSAVSESFFGITITGSTWLHYHNGWTSDLSNHKAVYPPSPLPIHKADDGIGYCNGWITVEDGWQKEFFYYSPAPYQSYVLWSAGPNHKTFPPWIALEDLSQADRATAMGWKADDLSGMGEGIPHAKETNVLDFD